MKVFGIGMPRTGTTSLHQAMGVLGYRSVHFAADAVTVGQLRAGDYRLRVVEAHDHLCDVPVPAVFAQLDAAFPGSRFIHTVRDPESWIASHRRAAFNARLPEPGSPRDFYRAMLYGVTAFNEARFRWVLADHDRRVRAHFADRPGDLLTLDLTTGAGWGALCRFLGRPVPEVPFPHRNSSAGRDRVV